MNLVTRTPACWVHPNCFPRTVWLTGPALEAFNSTERHAIFGSNTPDKIAACLGLHTELLRQLRAAVDALGALAVILHPLPRHSLTYMCLHTGVEAATSSERPGPLSPERGPTAPEAAAALYKIWLS